MPSAVKVLALPSGAEPGSHAVGTPTHTLWPFASYPIPLPPQTHTLRKLTTIPGTLHQLPSVEVLTASSILIPYFTEVHDFMESYHMIPGAK